MQNQVKEQPIKGNQADLPPQIRSDISPDDAARVLKEHKERELQEKSEALYAFCRQHNIRLEVEQRVVIRSLY